MSSMCHGAEDDEICDSDVGAEGEPASLPGPASHTREEYKVPQGSPIQLPVFREPSTWIPTSSGVRSSQSFTMLTRVATIISLLCGITAVTSLPFQHLSRMFSKPALLDVVNHPEHNHTTTNSITTSPSNTASITSMLQSFRPQASHSSIVGSSNVSELSVAPHADDSATTGVSKEIQRPHCPTTTNDHRPQSVPNN